MSTAPDKTMRADARRNREKLLAAAAELFAAEGTDVPLETVARRADVGIGTLYRHFPTRDALIAETYRNEVAHVADGADELLASMPADQAMEEWLERFIVYAAAKRGMADALKSMSVSREELFPQARQRITETLGVLLSAGVEAGTIRPDVDADDVYRATMAIWNIPNEDGWIDQARTVLHLIMDGLRYGARPRP
jgi:AcrR family transcriptional regulator